MPAKKGDAPVYEPEATYAVVLTKKVKVGSHILRPGDTEVRIKGKLITGEVAAAISSVLKVE